MVLVLIVIVKFQHRQSLIRRIPEALGGMTYPIAQFQPTPMLPRNSELALGAGLRVMGKSQGLGVQVTTPWGKVELGRDRHDLSDSDRAYAGKRICVRMLMYIGTSVSRWILIGAGGGGYVLARWEFELLHLPPPSPALPLIHPPPCAYLDDD